MSKQKTLPLWRKILWRGFVFPVFALAILALGGIAFLSGVTDTTEEVKNVVVVDSPAQAKAAQAKMKEATEAGKVVWMEICDGEFCTGQVAELDKVAEKYKDKVFFIKVKPSQIAPLLPKISELTGGKLAYPLHFIDTRTGPVVQFGIMSADELTKLLDSALTAPTIPLPSALPAIEPATKDGAPKSTSTLPAGK